MRSLSKYLSALIIMCAVASWQCFDSSAALAQQGGKIVYIGIGGATQDAIRKALFEPFQKETGIQVVEDTGLSTERIQAEVQSGRPTVDFLTIGTGGYLTLLSKSMLAKIDYKYYAPEDIKGMPEAVRLEFAVGSVYSSLGMSFSKAAFPDGGPQPNSWADFWDVQKFPGKRTLPYCGVLEGSWPIAEAALMADGVPMDKLYPLDFQRAVKKLKELSPHVIWWKNTSQPGQYLVAKEAVMALNSIGRTNAITDGGTPLQYVWNGAQVFGDKWIVLKGAPNYDNVMRFLAFVARPKIQAELARLIGYAPTNTAAFDYIDKKDAVRLSTYPDNFKLTFPSNPPFWADNVTKWTEICLGGLSG